jgi:hypothetical protein
MPPLEPPVALKAQINEIKPKVNKFQSKRSPSNISVDKPWEQTTARATFGRMMVDERKSSFNLLNDSVILQGISDIKVIDKNYPVRNQKISVTTRVLTKKPSADLSHLSIYDNIAKKQKVSKEEKLQLNMPVTIEQEEEYYLRRSIE